MDTKNKRELAEKRLQERFGDPIGSYAGDAPVGVRSIDEDVAVCPSCGMMPIEDECGCDHGGVACSGCGMPPEICACSTMMPEGVEPCDECGMLEVEEGCGCTHTQGKEEKTAGLEEVTPPGYEKVVKALKGQKDIESPWAVAWSMRKKGIRPKRKD